MADEPYRDDESIQNEWTLWRRIPPWHIVPDGDGGRRPSSAAFENDPDGDPMSVIIVEKGGDLERALEGHVGFGVAAVTVAAMRERGQQVVFAPTDEEPAHGLVVGTKHKRRFCKKVAKAAKQPRKVEKAAKQPKKVPNNRPSTASS